MSRRTSAVMFGIANQTVALRFPKGQPTSATFKVFRAFIEIDDNNATPEFQGAAVIDSVNTTITAAAGSGQADPQKLVPSSFTNILTQKRYLLQQNSVQEWVDLVEVQTGSYVRARYPLQYAYSTSPAPTLQSTWMTAAIDNTWIADNSKISDLSDTFPDFRIRWDVVYAGATYVTYTYFDVVREQGGHHVEIDDINARAPGLVDSLPIEYRTEDGRPLIDAAWGSVRAQLQAMNIDVNAIREDEVIDELVTLRSLRALAEGGWHPPQFTVNDYVTLTTGNYDRFFEQHFAASLKHRLDYQLGPLNRTLNMPTSNRPWFGK